MVKHGVGSAKREAKEHYIGGLLWTGGAKGKTRGKDPKRPHTVC
jgi:hypothetical protein